MLSKVFLSAATACGLFVSSVNSHMVITSPVPYGESSLTNSPLAADGSDFPCKQRSGVYDVTKMNNMKVGVPQTLAFKGGASHGGGSCQVSVTFDKEPTKDSDWKVIHSIIGGCPTNDTGNISGDPNYTGAAVFDFSIPKGMPNGQYTLAWTWFNKVGNREMYMNCAPITVSGGGSNNDVLNSLPSMFVANVPVDKCTTTEGTDVAFPDPGSSVETGGSAILGKPVGASCGASGSGGSGGSPPASSAASPATSYGAPFAAPAYTQDSAPVYGTGSAAGPTAAAGNPSFPFRGAGVVNGGISPTTLLSIIGSAPTAAAQTGATTQAPSYTPSEGSTAGSSDSGSSDSGSSNSGSSDSGSAAAPSYEAPGTDAGNSSASSGSCTGGAVSCPNPGSVVCIGSSQWGLCDIENCAVPRALSDGTSCAAGVVNKRHLGRHARSHMHHARSI